MSKAHVYISGFVQGVGYRQFVKREARNLNLTGWVRNLPDGRVEAVFQGDKKNIEEAIKACHSGPFLSSIENVEIVWEETERTLDSFEVVNDL